MPGDRARTVANDGVRLHVREWPGGGDDVLLIHGLASSSHIWDLVAPRLVRLGLHPVAYDQRGHGRSSKPSSGYGFDRDHGRRRRGDPRDAAPSTDRRRALVGSERRARARGPPVSLGRRDGAARRRLPHDARPVRLGDREADARTTRVRRDHGRRVPPAHPPQPGGARSPSRPSSTRSSCRSSAWIRRGGSGHVCRGRTTSRSSERCGNRTRSGCSNASASRRWSWPRVRARAGRPHSGFERDKAIAARRVRTIGPPVSFAWIEGIHDVPLQRPEAVARRIAKLAEAAARVRRRRS